MELSKKVLSVGASPTLVIDAKAKKMKLEGIDVVGFGAGEPDFETPKFIKEAAIKAIQDGFTRYTPVSGIMELKKAVCKKLKSDQGLDYDPSCIVISNGAKHSIMNALMAVCNPGDEVIIVSPYWVSYPEMIRLADANPIIIEAKEQNGFKCTLKQLEEAITEKTKAMIINSPCNPTGVVYSHQELKELGEIAARHNIYIISDEIYEKLVYGGIRHESIASVNARVKELTIVINGLSKAYAMTGWRIGYSASCAKIAGIMSNLQSHCTSNPNSIAQKAAEAALTGCQDEVMTMVSEFSRRRDYMVERINSIEGLSCLKPDGAFYVMVNISSLLAKRLDGTIITSTDEFVELLLDGANVAAVPGAAFGCDKYVRLSYATSMENIIKGMDRIEALISKIQS